MDAGLREELSREKGEALPDLSINPGVVFEFTTPPGRVTTGDLVELL